MKILVNNKQIDTTAQHLSDLAAEIQLPATGVAVAVNNKMVPRQQWNDTPLCEGANIVIIKAACGG